MASSPSVSDTKPQQAADLVLVSSAQLSAVSAALKDAERRAREDFPGNRQIREWLRSHRKSVFAKVKRNCVVIEERDQRRKQQLMEEYQSLESELKVLQSRLKRKRREVPLMYAEWANQEIKDAENQADRVEDMEDLEGMAEYEADKKLLKSKIEELAKTCEQVGRSTTHRCHIHGCIVSN
jgi:predicted nuclease with TOPRIM domain